MKKLIGIGIAVILAVVAVVFTLSSPKDLIINEGNPVSIHMGDTVTLDITGDGLKDGDVEHTVFSVNDTSGVAVDGNTLKGLKDGEYEIYASLKKGIRTWSGTQTMTVSCDELKIKNNIKVYMGKKKSIDFSGEKLPEYVKASSITWYSEDEDIVKVEDGKLVAVNYGDVVVHGEFTDGERKWEGATNVKVRYKKVSFKNGQMLKKASGQAPVKVNAPDDMNCYIYFKSVSGGKSFSFLVKKGKSVKVSAPTGTYELYYACGKTWYGKKYKFGPDTQYIKAGDKFKFYISGNTVYGTEVTLKTVVGGNLSYEGIDGSDFPG